MSNRGRPAKPRALKISEAMGIPSCPACLGAEGKREWRRVTKELIQLNLLSKVDRGALTVYCEAWDEFIKLIKQVNKEGVNTITSNGTIIQNPTLGAKNKASERVLKAAAQFGMTPAARAKIEIADKKPTGKLKKYIQQPRAV